MGGSGSSSPGGSTTMDRCSFLKFKATINSPQSNVVQKLSSGDEMDVSTSQHSSSIEVLFNGQIAGSLTGSQVSKLLSCINSGFIYKAVVLSLNGGQCVVEVSPK